MEKSNILSNKATSYWFRQECKCSTALNTKYFGFDTAIAIVAVGCMEKVGVWIF